MERILENEFLSVKIDDKGAELVSIWDKEKEREVLWQADPAFWGRHAPILFPNVGKHYENRYRLKGKTYASKQHGFARDTQFDCVNQTADSVTHEMKSSEATRKEYPFDFLLQVKHVLSDRKLSVCWTVISRSGETMYFTIGGHPAFNVPILPDTKRSDYLLSFGGLTSVSYLLLNESTSTADTSHVFTLKLENGFCPITDSMFDQDALIIDNQIHKAGISLPDGSPYVELACEGFPNFGVWSAKGGAPFVCLEPWCGRVDDDRFAGELSEKPYISALEPGEKFERTYTISVF